MKQKSRRSRKHQRRQRQAKIGKLLIAAQACHARQEFERANALYHQVLELAPDNIAALNGLGIIALDIGMLDTALEILVSALSTDPANTALRKSLALVLTRLDRFDDAIACYRQLLDEDGPNADWHGELARLYLLSGDMDAALGHFRSAFELDPSNPKNLHGLIQLDRQAVTSDMLKTIESQLDRAELSLSQRASFYFALGAIHDQAGRYDDAFANYSVANLAKPMRYDHDQFTAFVTDTINTFTPEFFSKHAHAGIDTCRPVFIVGMPRSGTTLVEQMLSSHPDVYAGGELNHIENLVKAMSAGNAQDLPYPLRMNQFSDADLLAMAKGCAKQIDTLASADASRVTDKMPVNFLYLGLIAILFPNAYIIHCRRDPLDTCLSCYFQNFSGNHPYAGDLLHLGQYFRQYQRLMSHWYSVLPVPVHSVSYEELVTEPENSCRHMFDYTGLGWHPDCLQFHRNRRTVRTASVVQVRRPLYRTSVGRWRRYDKYLHPLRAALGQGESASPAVKANAHEPQHVV